MSINSRRRRNLRVRRRRKGATQPSSQKLAIRAAKLQKCLIAPDGCPVAYTPTKVPDSDIEWVDEDM